MVWSNDTQAPNTRSDSDQLISPEMKLEAAKSSLLTQENHLFSTSIR